MENLKEKYMEEVRKVWKDEGMRDFCEKQFFGAVEISDGMICLDKEKVKTRFCYGEDGGESLNRAISNCYAVEHKLEVFIRENIKRIERDIYDLKEMLKEINQTCWIRRAWIGNKYSGESNKLKFWTILYSGREDAYKGGIRQATKDDLEKILKLYEEFKEYRIKQCKTYWKRYGGSKLHTWTYWENA